MSRSYLWGQIKQLYKTLSINKKDQTIKWPHGSTYEYRKEFNTLKEKSELQKKSVKRKEDKLEIQKKSTQEDDTCPICYDKMQNPIKLDCGHKFDNHCIRRLIVIHNNDKCPLCRKIFNYKINKRNKKMYRKLKKELLEKLRNKYGRIHKDKLINVIYFLDEKDISIDFIDKLALVLMINIKDNYEYDWLDMDKDFIYAYDKSKPSELDDNMILYELS